MNLIRQAEQQIFADFVKVENVPEIMHSYIIPYARRTVYGNARVFVFKQLLEAPPYRVWQHHAITSQVTEIHPRVDAPGLHLGVTLSSLNVHSMMRGGFTEHVQQGDLNLFYVTQEEKAVTIHPGTHCFLNIEFDEALLPSLADNAFLEETILPAIANNLRGGVINMNGVTMDAYCSLLLEQIRNPLGGNTFARSRYISKQCELLLIHFFARLQKELVEYPPLTNEDVNSIDSVKAHIKANTTGISTVELCQLFDIPVAKLQEGFKGLYGTSVEAFVILWRLEKAALLLTKKDACLEKIAKETGYKNVDTFVNSFTRYYNCTPEQFRKL
ncbi:helix-turn-helix domain-containing protein [Chitinophaga sancti]|uniref:AraC-type DNA-binding protein n=1 Tax=Chitinophaga sancti TaxID=1004 RepID=A0A1K1QTF6_9BACT|nr:helix-turn-helix domain-containing protein [Chitinophaga sancti]WQD61918.1 helix-turn-helix domain-containing protein [Chitinophaga sancti]WQG92513.1 helix-turn-helix domain-containing protein [Chitinophaga sancti]SFW63168.1 AraC-type DNA-binding protein [Chitinophaga sancti]